MDQILTSVIATATAQKGALRSRSQPVSRRRCHQTMISSTSGKITTEPLLSAASTKAAKLSQ